MTGSRIAVVSACVTVGLSAAATPVVAQTPLSSSPAPHTLTVVGSAQVKPTPRDAQSNASIKKAVADARREALPLAIANGRGRAAQLSQLSGLVIGELISIAEAGPGPLFFGPFGGEEGTFGPGQYCGTVSRPVFRVDAQGRRRVVDRRSRRQCRVPRFVSANLTMVFSTA
jgi:hypothetical protein